MGVFPSDHVIGNPARFLELVRGGVSARPSRRHDGGGDPSALAGDRLRLHRIPAKMCAWARSDPVPVRKFHEKPNADMARRYVDAGHFYWNAGMFFWRADVMLDELRQHLPTTADLIASLPPFRRSGVRRAAEGHVPAC